MSRSNNVELKNPASKFLNWSSESGNFRYYDKTSEKNIHLELPFTFLVLDTLATIKGGNEVQGKYAGYWSNEVRNIKTDILTVRDKTGICATGTYMEVKNNPACTGAKYAQSVYIAFKGLEGLEIANIQMTGSCLSAWIEFCKKNKVYDEAVSVESFTEEKKGITKFKKPVFKKVPTSQATDEIARELDKELQDYLTKYFNVKVQEVQHETLADKQYVSTSEELEQQMPDEHPF